MAKWEIAVLNTMTRATKNLLSFDASLILKSINTALLLCKYFYKSFVMPSWNQLAHAMCISATTV